MALSTRANDVLKANSNVVIWQVLADLYDPETNPNGYYSVGVAENVLMHDYLLDHLHQHISLTSKYLTYNDGPSGSKRLKAAMARFLNRRLHPATPLEPHHLVLTNGVSSAVEHLSWAFADKGEGILLGRPYYGTFIPDLSMRFGTEVVTVPFEGADPFGADSVADCVDAYRRAMTSFEQRTGKKCRALLLCHPHNPLGRCYPRDVLVALMRLCQEHGMHFISDEIYALSVWGGGEFVSVLSIDTKGIIDADRVHVLWGMSKDFGANGLRLGALISQGNKDVRAAVDSAALYSYVSGPADHLAANILEDDAYTDEYIRLNCEKLKEAYEYTVEFLAQNQIPYMAGANAGFFLWVDLGTPYLKRHPEAIHADLTEVVMQQLLKNKVFLASGGSFGSETPGWFRIIFAHRREYLNEALRRVVAAIQ